MKLKTGIIALFLFIGLIAVPNCIFAQSYEPSASEGILQGNLPSLLYLNSLNPELKSGSSSKSSSSKKIHSGDDQASDNSTDDGNSGWSWIVILIIIIVVLGIIGFLVWFLLLRHR